jgi:hypothetical protein
MAATASSTAGSAMLVASSSSSSSASAADADQVRTAFNYLIAIVPIAVVADGDNRCYCLHCRASWYQQQRH